VHRRFHRKKDEIVKTLDEFSSLRLRPLAEELVAKAAERRLCRASEPPRGTYGETVTYGGVSVRGLEFYLMSNGDVYRRFDVFVA